MALRRISPTELIAQHNALRASVSSSAFFGPKYQKERERYCAGHFALAYASALAPCEVAFEEPDPQNHIDFFLSTHTGCHAFQVVERQEPGRRRGDEYRKGKAVPADEQSLSLATVEGASWIAESIELKRHAYAGDLSGLNLLVYVNFPAHDLAYASTVEQLPAATNDFGSIWLLTGNALCCVRASVLLGKLPGWFATPAATSEA